MSPDKNENQNDESQDRMSAGEIDGVANEELSPYVGQLGVSETTTLKPVGAAELDPTNPEGGGLLNEQVVMQIRQFLEERDRFHISDLMRIVMGNARATQADYNQVIVWINNELLDSFRPAQHGMYRRRVVTAATASDPEIERMLRVFEAKGKVKQPGSRARNSRRKKR